MNSKGFKTTQKLISTKILIKELIEEKGITQEQLSKDIGITTKSISNWFSKDIIIRENNLKILAKYFDVDLEYLLCKQAYRKKSDEENSLPHGFNYYDADSRYEELKNILNISGVEINFFDFLMDNPSNESDAVRVREELSSKFLSFDFNDSRYFVNKGDIQFKKIKTIRDEYLIEYEVILLDCYCLGAELYKNGKCSRLTNNQLLNLYDEIKAVIKTKVDSVIK